MIEMNRLAAAVILQAVKDVQKPPAGLSDTDRQSARYFLSGDDPLLGCYCNLAGFDSAAIVRKAKGWLNGVPITPKAWSAFTDRGL